MKKMNAQSYNSTSHVPSGGTDAENKRRQEQWDEFQSEQQSKCRLLIVTQITHTILDNSEQSTFQTSSLILRKRADSHQPLSRSQRNSDASQIQAFDQSMHTLPQGHAENPKQSSGASHEYGSTLSPPCSPSSRSGEVRRLSTNWNAPTGVELERTREHRRSLNGMERLRSKVKGWVRM
jgi:hypothetical protein